MKLWRRAAAALKDQNSILLANLSRQTSYRIPDLEAAVIKATSHDDARVDYKNAQRVFSWIRTSPVSLKPLIWALSTRMEKTRSWVVAIKGLMLMHGIFCCKNAAVQRIGRLPFDLSSFLDAHSRTGKACGFNAFVRAYYAFLDQRSALLYERRKAGEEPRVQELSKLQNLQALLDLLLQVKPQAYNMRERLVLEAMDCVIIEIFDVYSRICNAIAEVLVGIYSAGKIEAILALKVLQKATAQGEELAGYFEFCKDFGVFNAMEVPKVTHIPEEDIRDLERIINGVSDTTAFDKAIMVVRGDDAAIVEKEESSKSGLKTIITNEWEVFDEDLKANNQGKNNDDVFHSRTSSYTENELEKITHPNYLPIIVPVYKQDIPDLISF